MQTVTSFLLSTRYHSYFVSNCSCPHRCFLYSLFHSSILLSLFLWLALHLRLSNIIPRLASFSAPHHLNSYHYNPPRNCPHSPKQPPPATRRLPRACFSFFLTCSPTCSFYQSLSPPCPHLPSYSTIFHSAMPQREQICEMRSHAALLLLCLSSHALLLKLSMVLLICKALHYKDVIIRQDCHYKDLSLDITCTEKKE